MTKVGQYLSLVKFSHTVFALPFAIIGFTMGTRQPGGAMDTFLLGKILLCMVFARTAAMAFNRWADRDIDAKNPRTVVREIPAGLISSRSALLFSLLNAVAFIVTTWFINTLCFYLSFIALAVVMGYSYTKRFTALCHFVLGLGLSLAPIGAWLAVTGEFALLPLYFSFAVFAWVSGFDIIYALQDETFDKKHQLHSIPGMFGTVKALMLSRNLHLASSLFLLAAGAEGEFGWPYYLGWVIFSLLLVYQHRLVKPNDLSRINLAFFTTNGFASIVFAALVIIDLLNT